jgi:hypothetical protein
MGAVPGYQPDRHGGLEIVKWHTGAFAVRTPPPPGQDPQDEHPIAWNFIFPRKRQAAAMRQLLLDAVGCHWSALPPGRNGENVRIADRETALRLRRLVEMAEDFFNRRAYQVCLLCGYAPSACACGRPAEPRDPRRWTADDMAWAK